MRIEHWRSDVRQALTGLRRSPGLAVAAIVTLALGLGANFALFSALDAVLWRSLPVPNPRQIFLLDRSDHDARFSYPLLQDLRRALRGRAEIAATIREPAAFNAPGQGITDDQVRAQLVSGNFFSVLRLRAWRGRLLTLTDNAAPSGRAVAVISYAFWRAHYHGAGALGTTLTLNRVPLAVVGIAPPGFRGTTRGNPAEVWLPLRLQLRLAYVANAAFDSDRGYVADDWRAVPWPEQSGISWLRGLVRVPANANLAALAAQATVVAQRELAPHLAKIEVARKRTRFAAERIAFDPGARGLNDLAAQIAQPLWILAAMAGFVLLVACLNIAMLLLARGAARRREYAIRLAVGAGGGALLRQAILEGIILSLLGGGGGLLLALWGRATLLSLLGVSHAPAILAGNDGLVLGFAATLSLATGILFSLAPGWRASRVSPLAALADRAPAGAKRRGGGLVVWQVAVSLVLLIGAGLLARSLAALTSVNSGFALRGVLIAHIDPLAAGYHEAQLPSLELRILQRLNALPGVAASGLALCGHYCSSTGNLGVAAGAMVNRDVPTHADLISTGYLAARGLHLVRGRDFTAADAPGSPPVAIVDQTFVRRYLGGFDPLQARVESGGGGKIAVAIVGVVADARLAGPRQPSPPFVFYPLAQYPAQSPMALAIRTSGPDAAALAPALRAALAAAALALPVSDIRTMQAAWSESWRDATALAKLSGGLALLALALACLGLYGVAAYGVARRGAEIGTRAALGARRGRIFALIWGEMLRTTLVGALIGLGLAWPLVRLARGLLFGVRALDAWTWAVALAILFAAASLAALAPAWRAARLEPWAALRRE